MPPRPFGVAGGIVPPESPLLARHRAALKIKRAASRQGHQLLQLDLVMPPLTIGGREYLDALATSDFFVNLGTAILQGRVVIIPQTTVAKRESAAAMLNNALQILAFAADKVDALYATSKPHQIQDEPAHYCEAAQADLKAAVRRICAALNDLAPASLSGALNDPARAEQLRDDGAGDSYDDRQLTLLDGGRQ